MKPQRPAEPVERVLPAAVLHVWADGIGALQAELEAAAPRIPGTEPVGTGRFVALLCAPGASYVNGQSIALDGGQAFLG